LLHVISTYGATLTVALIMGVEQNILAVIAIILFINPLKTEKSEITFPFNAPRLPKEHC
jgi:hypothetical protein